MTDLIGIIEDTELKIEATIRNTELKIETRLVESGARGLEGKNAYEVWLKEGNEGTIDDFFNSLTVSSMSYNLLLEKPSIEGRELEGDKTFEELGIALITKEEIFNLL